MWHSRPRLCGRECGTVVRVMVRGKPLLASICALIAIQYSLTIARGDLVSLSAARDNTLYQNEFGAISNGAGEHLFTGVNGFGEARRGLLQFDVAGAIPAGAMIQNAELTLSMSRTASAVEPVELHRVLTDWGEGASDAFNEEGTGATAAIGDATWLHTFYNTDFWSNPGGDFDPVASADRLVGGIGFYTWASAGLYVDVQAWLDDPTSNFGWILLGDEAASSTAKRFDTRENSDPDAWPVLVIDYTPLPEPAPLLFLMLPLALGRSRMARWLSAANGEMRPSVANSKFVSKK